MSIAVASTDEEIQSCFEVMRELRPHLRAESFVSIVRELERDGYSLAYCEAEGQVTAVAGYRIKRTLYCDKFLYVDDLVTAADHRSRGIGRALLRWLEERGRALDCAGVHLDSGMHRKDAHRFYDTNGFVAAGYNFRFDLDPRVPWDG